MPASPFQARCPESLDFDTPCLSEFGDNPEPVASLGAASAAGARPRSPVHLFSSWGQLENQKLRQRWLKA